MKGFKSLIFTLLRLIAGGVFIFSGFVKGVDVSGSAIKFHDYFQALHLDFLQFLSLPLAFAMPLLEFLTGISLFFRLHLRTGIKFLLGFMLVFTPLTLYLAIFNPVKDCGCFGDALVITNWQTFWKNVVLLGIALYLIRNLSRIPATSRPHSDWSGLGIFAVLFAWIAIYSYRNLPVLDFRPYHVGASIPGGMSVPDGAPEDVYETTLIYEKDGVRKEFSMDNFPWQDSTWTFVEQKTRLISKGYEPPIHDFDMILPDGSDITEQVLYDPGYQFLLISPNLSGADTLALIKAFQLSLAAGEQKHGFYLLTASGPDDVNRVFSQLGIHFPWVNTDETTLKTIVRSNPGLLLLHDGVILRKWGKRKIPGAETVSSSLLVQSIQNLSRSREKMLVFALSLLSLILGFIIHHPWFVRLHKE